MSDTKTKRFCSADEVSFSGGEKSQRSEPTAADENWDTKFSTVQRLISKAVSAIAFGITELKECKDVGVYKALLHYFDTIALLGSAQQRITAQRKMTQKAALPYDIRDIYHMPSDGTEWLYGDDVKKLIKDVKEHRNLAVSASLWVSLDLVTRGRWNIIIVNALFEGRIPASTIQGGRASEETTA
ncbi:hypothetical protein PoB_005939900 [Plakobranchus ocellatus]|uniref:Uncharacterized protein n=1 Tax=Plakobranchus ocellatus TaxID=259542 RepID=A0AAV4CN82_9GAST|nr:hypothetical protein PoB_005939900 [Plakobranchus ocellatus]